jgi:RimJ/RimL family protein N-acetyltransferase
MNDLDNFPNLVTDRLRLRLVRVSDVPRLMEYCNDKEVGNNLLTLPYPYKEEHAVFWMNSIYEGYKSGERYVFVIADKISDQLLGAIGLHLKNPHEKAEIGYWMGKSHRNQGYTTEAIQAVLKFGFQTLRLNKIYALHFKDNPASGKVLQKSGMHLEAEMKDHYSRKEGTGDVIQYAIFMDSYLSE